MAPPRRREPGGPGLPRTPRARRRSAPPPWRRPTGLSTAGSGSAGPAGAWRSRGCGRTGRAHLDSGAAPNCRAGRMMSARTRGGRVALRATSGTPGQEGRATPPAAVPRGRSHGPQGADGSGPHPARRPTRLALLQHLLQAAGGWPSARSRSGATVRAAQAIGLDLAVRRWREAVVEAAVAGRPPGSRAAAKLLTWFLASGATRGEITRHQAPGATRGPANWKQSGLAPPVGSTARQSRRQQGLLPPAAGPRKSLPSRTGSSRTVSRVLSRLVSK